MKTRGDFLELSVVPVWKDQFLEIQCLERYGEMLCAAYSGGAEQKFFGLTYQNLLGRFEIEEPSGKCKDSKLIMIVSHEMENDHPPTESKGWYAICVKSLCVYSQSKETFKKHCISR